MFIKCIKVIVMDHSLIYDYQLSHFDKKYTFVKIDSMNKPIDISLIPIKYKKIKKSRQNVYDVHQGTY